MIKHFCGDASRDNLIFKLNISLSDEDSDLDLLKNRDKFESIIKEIIVNEDYRESRLLNIGLNFVNGNVEYTVNNRYGSINADAVSSEILDVAVKIYDISLGNIRVDRKPNDRSFISVIRDIWEWIVALFYKLIGKTNPKDMSILNDYQLASDPSSLVRLLDAMKIMSNGLSISSEDELTLNLSNKMHKASERSENLYKKTNITSFNNQFIKSLKQSIDENFLILEQDPLSTVHDLWMLENCNQTEESKREPGIVSYTITPIEVGGQEGANAFDLVIRVINVEDGVANISELKKKIMLDKNNIQGIKNEVASCVQGACGYLDSKCSVSKNVDQSVDDLTQHLQDQKKWCILRGARNNDFTVSSLKDVAEIYSMELSKDKVGSFKFTTEKAFSRILDIMLDEPISKLDLVKLHSIYVHSYACHFLQLCKKNALSKGSYEHNLFTLQILLNELNAMAQSAYKLHHVEYSDVFLGSSVIKDLLAKISEIKHAGIHFSVNLDASLLSIAEGAKLNAGQLVDNFKPEEIEDKNAKIEDSSELINATYKFTQIVRGLSNDITKDSQKLLLSEISSLRNMLDDGIKNNKFASVFDAASFCLNKLPPPSLNPVGRSKVWEGLTFEEIENVSADLTTISKHMFESSLRLGITDVPNTAFMGLIKVRMLHHKLLNDALDINGSSKELAFLNGIREKFIEKASYKSIEKDELGNEITKVIYPIQKLPIYARNMYEWMHKSNAHPGCVSVDELPDRAELSDYILHHMSLPHEDPITKSDFYVDGEIIEYQGLALSGVIWSGNYGVPNLLQEKGILKGSLSNERVKLIHDTHHGEIDRLDLQSALDGTSADGPQSGILNDNISLELFFKAMLSPGKTVTINSNTSKKPQFSDLKNFYKDVKSNVDCIASILEKVPAGDLQVSMVEIRPDDINTNPEFHIKCSDYTSIMFHEAKRPIVTDEDRKTAIIEDMPHGGNVMHGGMNQELLGTAIGEYSSLCESDVVIDVYGKQIDVSNLPRHTLSRDCNNFDPRVVKASDLLGLEHSVDNWTKEQNTLLSSLKIMCHKRSVVPNIHSALLTPMQYSHATIQNIFLTCIQKPEFLDRLDSVRVIESCFLQGGVLAEAILQDSKFFADNANLLDSSFFSKNILSHGKENNKTKSLIATLHLRAVMYSTAKIVRDRVKQQIDDNKVKAKLFGDYAYLDNKLKELDSFIENENSLCVNQHPYDEWVLDIACNSRNEKFRDFARGYAFNIYKNKDSTTSGEELNDDVLCDIIGSYLQNIGLEKSDYGFPLIEQETDKWVKFHLIPNVLARFSDVKFRNEFLSKCYSIASMQPLEMESWETYNDSEEVFRSDSGKCFSINKGLHVLDDVSFIRQKMTYQKLSHSTEYKKVFGSKDLSTLFVIKNNQDGTSLSSCQIDDKTLIEVQHNPTAQNKYLYKLILTNEDGVKDVYCYANLSSLDESLIALEKGVWVNNDITKTSLSTLGTSMLDIHGENLLNVYLSRNAKKEVCVDKICNFDESSAVATSDDFIKKGFYSVAGDKAVVFINNNPVDNITNVTSIKIPSLNASFINKDGKFIASSHSFSDYVISDKAIDMASKALFLGAEQYVIPFEAPDGKIKILCSIDPLKVKEQDKAPSIMCDIEAGIEGYNIDASACGYFLLALRAAESKDYNMSIKLLNKVMSAHYNDDETEIFDILAVSWNKILESHKSKKAAALCAKAFVIGANKRKFCSLGCSREHPKYKKAFIDVGIKSIDQYNHKVLKLSDDVELIITKAEVEDYMIASAFKLSPSEKEDLYNLVLESDVSLADIISKKLNIIISMNQDRGLNKENFIDFIEDELSGIIDDVCSFYSYSSIAISKELLREAILNTNISTNSFKYLQSENRRNILTEFILSNLKTKSIELGIDLPTEIKKNVLSKRISVNNDIIKQRSNLPPLDNSISKSLADKIEESQLPIFNMQSLEAEIRAELASSEDIIRGLVDVIGTKSKDIDVSNAKKVLTTSEAKKDRNFAIIHNELSSSLSLSIYDANECIKIEDTITADIEKSTLNMLELHSKIISNNFKFSDDRFNYISDMRMAPNIYSQNDILEAIIAAFRSGMILDKALEEDITLFLLEETKIQQLKMSGDILNKLKSATDTKEKSEVSKALSDSLARAYNYRRVLDPTNDALLSQHYRIILAGERSLGIIIRDDQKGYLDSLLKDENNVVLCPTGGGKSAVLAPMFGAIKANNNQFPVFVTLDPLLDAAAMNVRKFNKQAFDQDQYTFFIDPSREYSNIELKQILLNLSEIAAKRGIIITSAVKMAFLENMLVDVDVQINQLIENLNRLIASSESCSEEGINLYLSKDRTLSTANTNIANELRFLKEKKSILIDIKEMLKQGDFLIDEVDQVFKNSTWVNHSLGSKLEVDLDLSEISNELMTKFVEYAVNNDNSACAIVLNSIRNNAQTTLTEKEIDDAIVEIAGSFYDNLLLLYQRFDNQAVANEFIKDVSRESFINFISAKDSCEAISIKNTEALIGSNRLGGRINDLQKLLGVTFRSIVREQRLVTYGIDKETGSTVAPKSFSVDLKSTKFSNHYESAIFHYLFYICSAPVFEEFDSFFSTICNIRTKHPDVSDFLSSLTGDDQEDSKVAFQKFCAPESWKIRMYFVRNHVIPKTTQNQKQIKIHIQDPFTANGLKFSGMSGTVAEKALPGSITIDDTVERDFSSETAMIKICKTLNKGVDTKLSSFKGTGEKELLDAAIDKKCVSIVNCGEVLEQESTFEVVSRIRNHLISNNVNKDIVFVDTITRNQMIWRYGESSPCVFSGGKLNDNTIAYYAFADSRGTDFKLPKGNGVVFTSKLIVEEDFIQAVNRLRDLGKGQNVEIILSQYSVEAINKLFDQPASEEVSLGMFLRKMQVDTVENSLKSNFKQVIRDLQTSTSSAIRNIIGMQGSQYKQDDSMFEMLVSNVVDRYIFDITKDYTIKVNDLKKDTELRSLDKSNSLEYVLRMYDIEINKLTNLLSDIEKNITDPNFVMKTIQFKNLSKSIDFGDESNNLIKNELRELGSDGLRLIIEKTTNDIIGLSGLNKEEINNDINNWMNGVWSDHSNLASIIDQKTLRGKIWTVFVDHHIQEACNKEKAVINKKLVLIKEELSTALINAKKAKADLDHQAISENIQDTIIVPAGGFIENMGDQDSEIVLSVSTDSEVDLNVSVEKTIEKSAFKEVSSASKPLSKRILSCFVDPLLANSGTSCLLTQNPQFMPFEFALRGVTEETGDVPPNHRAMHICADDIADLSNPNNLLPMYEKKGAKFFISDFYPYKMHTSMGLINNIQGMTVQATNGSLIYGIVIQDDVFLMTREEGGLLYPELFRDAIWYSKQDKNNPEVQHLRSVGSKHAFDFYAAPYERGTGKDRGLEGAIDGQSVDETKDTGISLYVFSPALEGGLLKLKDFNQSPLDKQREKRLKMCFIMATILSGRQALLEEEDRKLFLDIGTMIGNRAHSDITGLNRLSSEEEKRFNKEKVFKTLDLIAESANRLSKVSPSSAGIVQAVGKP